MELSFDILLTVGALAVIAATLLPFVQSDVWWVRSFDFPRMQIAFVGTVVLGLELLFRRDAGAIATTIRFAVLLCILYQSYHMRPYTLLARHQSKGARRPRKETTVSLLLANVKMENRNAELLRRIITDADPDLILVVEADEWWRNELDGFAKTHSFTVAQPQANTYGMLLYSRLELVRPKIRFLIETDIPSIRTVVRLPAGIEFEVYCLHPKPPVPQEAAQSTERDAELTIVAKEAQGQNLPVIVMGDLNDVAWSQTTTLFQKISGLLDPRIGRGFYNSFDARFFFLRFPLDHFFHSNHFRLIELKRLPYFGSDHFPMYIRLSYEPEARREQEAPASDAADEARAAEKISKAESQH
jgi:endonuclease/exonuclease/phosphatase (EEP) superfamily protein YafD